MSLNSRPRIPLDPTAMARSKERGKRWVMLTAYDCPTGEVVDRAGADLVLVGDSLGMVLLGHPTTTAVTMEEMLHHARAARRGVKRAALLADLPLSGLKKGPAQALRSCKRFAREAGCDGVKVEWGKDALKIAALLRRARIPFMGHVGLTPQTAGPKGYGVRGTTAAAAWEICRQALSFEEAGAFSVLIECVPEAVGQAVTRTLKVPVIGIGAGRYCDGQVLVTQDLAGLYTKFQPRFVRRYARLGDRLAEAVSAFARDTRGGRFPGRANVYGMKKEALTDFNRLRGVTARKKRRE